MQNEKMTEKGMYTYISIWSSLNAGEIDKCFSIKSSLVACAEMGGVVRERDQ